MTPGTCRCAPGTKRSGGGSQPTVDDGSARVGVRGAAAVAQHLRSDVLRCLCSLRSSRETAQMVSFPFSGQRGWRGHVTHTESAADVPWELCGRSGWRGFREAEPPEQGRVFPAIQPACPPRSRREQGFPLKPNPLCSDPQSRATPAILPCLSR